MFDYTVNFEKPVFNVFNLYPISKKLFPIIFSDFDLLKYIQELKSSKQANFRYDASGKLETNSMQDIMPAKHPSESGKSWLQRPLAPT